MKKNTGSVHKSKSLGACVSLEDFRRSTIMRRPYGYIGVVPIEEIQISTKSRDEVPRTLLVLQALWGKKRLLDQILSILAEQIDKKDINQGAEWSGIYYWRIYVLGVLKRKTDWTYDRLWDSACNHQKICQMLQYDDLNLGEGDIDELWGLIEDMSRITEKTWDKIDSFVAKWGQ